MAYQAVMRLGMFGKEAGFMSVDQKEISQEQRAVVDEEVKKILDESFKRVEKLLKDKEIQVSDLSKNLYWYDYIDVTGIENVMKGRKLDKEKVREWTEKEYVIRF